MKNILVTGGAGFIGSNFINYILDVRDDYNIINLDKLTYAGNLENLIPSETKKNYHFIKGDITNSELVNYLFQKFDIKYVINFAAESHVDRSILVSEIFFRSNVLGTNVLLEAARRLVPEGVLDLLKIRWTINYFIIFLLTKYMVVWETKDCLRKILLCIRTALTQQVRHLPI